MGSVSRIKDHPDSRAIFYNEVTYRFGLWLKLLKLLWLKGENIEVRVIFFSNFALSKKKIGDFLSTLEGFHRVKKLCALFQDHLETFKYVTFYIFTV